MAKIGGTTWGLQNIYIERERERERKTNPKTIPNPKCNPSGCGQTLSVPLAQSKKPFEE